VRFLYILVSFSCPKNVVISTMYKKLHTPEKEPSAEPFCDKGSFLWCVPERDIMLTKIEYDIQPKNRKKLLAMCFSSFFCYIHFIEGSKSYSLWSSLLLVNKFIQFHQQFLIILQCLLPIHLSVLEVRFLLLQYYQLERKKVKMLQLPLLLEGRFVLERLLQLLLQL
jgi:lipopolysaccharide biosynthesis glycosyltransferase